jgi:hypothetical protein
MAIGRSANVKLVNVHDDGHNRYATIPSKLIITHPTNRNNLKFMIVKMLA